MPSKRASERGMEPCEKGCVVSEFVISYISWDLITGVIRLINFLADIISARALGKLL